MIEKIKEWWKIFVERVEAIDREKQEFFNNKINKPMESTNQVYPEPVPDASQIGPVVEPQVEPIKIEPEPIKASDVSNSIATEPTTLEKIAGGLDNHIASLTDKVSGLKDIASKLAPEATASLSLVGLGNNKPNGTGILDKIKFSIGVIEGLLSDIETVSGLIKKQI